MPRNRMVSHRFADAPPAESRTVLDAIRRIVQALRVSSRASEQRLGLSGAQLFVLQTLARQGAWSLNDLADRTATHQSSVSVVVDKLVARELVRRTQSRMDKRRVELSITAAGRKLLARAPEAAQERLITGLSLLPDGDRKGLARALSELARQMQVSEERPQLFFEDDSNNGRARRKRPGRSKQQ